MRSKLESFCVAIYGVILVLGVVAEALPWIAG
jgi:hypothetical protein